MSSGSRSRFFPPTDSAPRHGLIRLGGRLDVDWLVDAYRHGIFPWPVEGGALAWWSPDPRAVLEFDRFHVPRSLRRTIRRRLYRVTCNQAFAEVIRGCGTAQRRGRATWITPDIERAYVELHRAGLAHSVEAWDAAGQLVGGVYGVALGGLFAAESMFYRAADASKVALVRLMAHLRARGYGLVDIQQLTAHSARFGARAIPRRRYLERLGEVIDWPVRFGAELAPLGEWPAGMWTGHPERDEPAGTGG